MGITQTAAGPGAWPHSPGARPASATGGDTERQMSPAPAVDQARCSQQLLPVNTRITSQRFHPRRQRHRGGFGSSRPHSPRRPRESGRPPGARTQPSGPGSLCILQVPSLRTFTDPSRGPGPRLGHLLPQVLCAQGLQNLDESLPFGVLEEHGEPRKLILAPSHPFSLPSGA